MARLIPGLPTDVFKKVDDLIADVRPLLGRVDDTLENVAATLVSVEDTLGTATATLAETTAVLAHVNKTLVNIDSKLEMLGQVPVILERLDSLSASMASVDSQTAPSPTAEKRR